MNTNNISNLLLIVILFIACRNSTSKIKSSTNNSTIETIQSLDHKQDINILIGCGIAGKDSKQLTDVAILIKQKDYQKIISLLKSDDKLTQFISTITLDQLATEHKIIMTSLLSEQINKFKQTSLTYSFCRGCSEHTFGKISDLFSSEDTSEIIQSIKIRLELIH